MLYTIVLFIALFSPPWEEFPRDTCYIIVDANGTVREICPPPPPTCLDNCGAN